MDTKVTDYKNSTATVTKDSIRIVSKASDTTETVDPDRLAGIVDVLEWVLDNPGPIDAPEAPEPMSWEFEVSADGETLYTNKYGQDGEFVKFTGHSVETAREILEELKDTLKMYLSLQ